MKTKTTKLVFLSALVCAFQYNIVNAQQKYCGTTEATQALYQAHPELVQKEIDYNNAITQQIKLHKSEKATGIPEPVYIIPIVFHILHTNGVENISDAQIFDEMTILNRDYAKLNADTTAIIPGFVSLAAKINVQFRLAQLDPNGNCTNGIDRIYSHKTNNADDASKLNQWPRDKYLNVWVVSSIGSAGVAGYAYYPSAVDGAGFPIDGVLILHNYIGSIGTSNVNQSRALTHEIGHWMNLQHPWGSTNSPEVACGDDEVDDTPVTKGHKSCDMDPICATAALTPYTFAGVSTTSGQIDTTHNTANAYINYGHFMANGVSLNSTVAGQFAFSNWDLGGAPLNAPSSVDADPASGPSLYSSMTGAMDPAKYYEITVTPTIIGVNASSITINSIKFNFQRNSTGVRSFAVRSSLDGYASNLAASMASDSLIKIKGTNEFFVRYDTASLLAGCTITPSPTLYKNHEGAITFRIYGWNAEDASGSFGIGNFSINGSAGTDENVQNYMDYSYCSVMFTLDQKDRMRTALQNIVSQRSNLWINSNLIATGTDLGVHPACVPHPDFYSNRVSVCPGGTVTFTQNITEGTPTATRWHFVTGPSPTDTSSSVAASPTITYNHPGAYSVTLYAKNASGSDAAVKTDYIYVSDAFAMVTPGLTTEDFDNSSLYYSRWLPEDLDHNSKTWWLTNTASFSGTQSVVMNAYSNYPFDVDNLYSPSYNLSFVSGAQFSFRCAAATKATLAADLNDMLKVYVSKDCGATWLSFITKTGTALCNNGYHAEEFVPNNSSQWALITGNIPSTYVTGNTRFKFEYTTGNQSNDVYIDDVNIEGTLGITNNSIDETSVSIYPNPTSQSSTLAYHLNKKADTRIEVIDILGKKIMEVNNLGQMEGDYTVQISKQDLHLNSGIYFVRISIDNAAITKKLIISE